MPEALKNYYSEEIVNSIAKDCKILHRDFDVALYVNTVLHNDWDQLELKQRMHRIAKVFEEFFPNDYQDSINILLSVAKNYSGLVHMCFPDYVEQYGLNDFDISMNALEQLTEGSTSEFAIRPFIIKYPVETMARMKLWSKSKNEHIRRLASEGCRPRLPWAMALPNYKKDPAEVIAIILNMVDDKSLYVRRSVANNLNDISKDNPNVVIEIAKKYLGKSKNIDWAIKHACRGLLKQGNKKILYLFGYKESKHLEVNNLIIDKKAMLGEKFNFQFEINTKKKQLGMLRIEFIIEFMKANGKLAGKIFKISEGLYSGKNKQINKYFSFKLISTRKYYLGEHKISIVINGDKIKTASFQLYE